MQDDLTKEIIAALKVKLTPEQKDRFARKGTIDVEAYNLFLRGRDRLWHLNRSGNVEARKLLERAVTINPDLPPRSPAAWNRKLGGRFLEPVKVIQVRPFKPKTFVIGQSDGDGVFMGGDEFERAVIIIIIMDSFVGEGFICTAHGDAVAVRVPADIYFVRRHAIEVCERALDGLAVDVSRVHESQLLYVFH